MQTGVGTEGRAGCDIYREMRPVRSACVHAAGGSRFKGNHSPCILSSRSHRELRRVETCIGEYCTASSIPCYPRPRIPARQPAKRRGELSREIRGKNAYAFG
jgi:hypothetical protein